MLSFGAAVENMGSGKQNQNYTIIQTCSDATYITLSTIQYPDKTVDSLNANMTALGGGAFSYILEDTSQVGRYDITGISDGCGETFVTYFEITPSGFIGTLGFYLIILIISLAIIVLGFSIKDGWIVVLGSFGFIMLGLFILLYGIDGLKDTAYTYAIGIITIMTGAYIGIRSAVEQIDL